MINQLLFTKPKSSLRKEPARRSSAEGMARRFQKLRGSVPQEPKPMEVEETTRSPTRTRGRAPSRVPSSILAEDLARMFSNKKLPFVFEKLPVEHMEEDLVSGSDEGEAEMAEEYSRDRHAIARGKRPAAPMEEDATSEDEEEETEEAKQPPRAGKKNLSPDELYKIFKKMVFTGTRYPHRETMKALGIKRNVEFLFEMCHLDTFMKRSMKAYEEETCFFLASLKMHF